jgi:DME family drug/metabolite transporter
VAAALLYTAPAFVLVLSRMFLAEPIDRLGVAALALLLCGVVLVTGAAHAMATGQVHVTPLAALLGLASGLTYGIYTLASKLSLRRTGPTGAVFWSFLFATAVLAIAAPPHDALLRDARSLPLLLGLGIVPTLLAYGLYLRGLTFLHATTAAMIASVEPVIAAVLGALFLAERVSADQALGVLAIVAGAALASRRERRVESEAPTIGSSSRARKRPRP